MPVCSLYEISIVLIILSPLFRVNHTTYSTRMTLLPVTVVKFAGK